MIDATTLWRRRLDGQIDATALTARDGCDGPCHREAITGRAAVCQLSAGQRPHGLEVLGGKLQKVFTTMRTIEPIREELLSQAKCLLYDGPVIDYEDADQTTVEGVREVGPTTGLALSAILNE